MPDENPRVCAVILNAYGLPVMEGCLRSMARVDYPALEIIVAHNGPENKELESGIRALNGRVREVIFNGANVGFAAGNNPAIRAALAHGADFVLLLNDDTEVAPDFLQPLVREALRDAAIGAAGPWIFYTSAPERIWFAGARFDRSVCSFSFPGADLTLADYPARGVQDTDYVTCCAALVSRRLIETAGLLDEGFFLYWEDADWGLRASAAGFRSVMVPDSRIWHKVSVSAGGNDSPFKIFHKARGRLKLAAKHSSAALPGLLLGYVRDAAWLALKSGRQGGFRKAAALAAGAVSYFLGGTGRGPGWLR